MVVAIIAFILVVVVMTVVAGVGFIVVAIAEAVVVAVVAIHQSEETSRAAFVAIVSEPRSLPPSGSGAGACGRRRWRGRATRRD